MNTSFFETNIMGIMLLILLFQHSWRVHNKTRSEKYLTYIIFFTGISMICDLVYFIGEGICHPAFIVLSYVLMILYYMTNVGAGYFWMKYTIEELDAITVRAHPLKKFYTVPAIILAILVLSSPWTHWIFYITEANIFVRGPFHFLQILLSYIYVFTGGITAFIQSQSEVLEDRRQHCRNLGFYTIIPLAGGSIQGLFPQVNAVLPSILVAMIMIYLDNIKQQVTLDPLTGLNNRGQFDNYLYKKIKSDHKNNLYVIFFDVDYFKDINDNFGHIEGDHALIAIANALKLVFGETKGFVARYGGDEFAVVMNQEEDVIRKLIRQLMDTLELLSIDLPYTLSVSVGYAYFDGVTMETIEDVTRLADDWMYKNKQTKRNIHHKKSD